MEIFKYYRHNPPHLFRDRAMYMVTAGTYQKQSVIYTDERKMFWYDTLKYVLEKYGWRLYAWVVLDNHYHVLLGNNAKSGDFAVQSTISSIISSLHKYTSRRWNTQDNAKGRKVWWNYWDSCVSDENAYYSRINYIHWNPVKHGYTFLPEKYKFSSYNLFIEIDKYGLKDIEERYPYEQVNLRDDF